MKLSKAQQKAYEEIKNAPFNTPDKNFSGSPFKLKEDFVSDSAGYVWVVGVVYGRFNSSTLKALARKGFIEIVELGDMVRNDIVKILK